MTALDNYKVKNIGWNWEARTEPAQVSHLKMAELKKHRVVRTFGLLLAGKETGGSEFVKGGHDLTWKE
jgi:hypothetical protein